MTFENVAYPFQPGSQGRSETAEYNDHVSQMIEQVLFTAPGERLNRPTFGCGIRQALFGPLGDVQAAATQMLIQSSLQQWLSQQIEVRSVEVIAEDSTLTISISYVVRRTGEPDQRTYKLGD
ncbi:MAG: GPW/gp25 family protein [Armatimonadetes bacterium]|nr:hypothetical protein [Armatimonadota bacterium]MBS1703839.1 GPW/gp25 family protein [Armatimonadota bacterium]MBS1726211.1 GPW/gp25 family protein [Armatimonadota bacterium]